MAGANTNIPGAAPGAAAPAAAPAKPPAAQLDAEATIKQIAEIKATMVPKAELEKAIADRDKFKNALLTGALEPDVAPPKSAAELRKDYAADVKSGVSNVKGFETALKLREAVLNETGADPFMTEALHKIDPDFGERVAQNITELLEKAEGSPAMFNALLSQNIR